MPHRLKRAVRLSLLSAAGLLPLLLLTALSLAQEKKMEKPETAGKRFKNIKALKDMPADQLIPTMHKYNKDLGVGCDFCHVIGPNHTLFEKDDKPEKLQARQMILMKNDLNKRYATVKAKVSCWTCHAGKAQPVNSPPAE